MGVREIRRAWDRTDAIDLAEGLVAYDRYRQMLAAVGREYGFDLVPLAGAFAALSPNNSYIGNLRSLCSLCHGMVRCWNEDECTVTTYNHCRSRAWKILAGVGHPLDLLTAPKTRNFFLNLTEPDHRSAITIDGHMRGVWGGHHLGMSEAGMTEVEYEAIAHDFRQFAFSQFLLPSQLQAVLWFTWKRINRVLYDPQTQLLNPSDNWRIIRDMSECTRFASHPFTKIPR